MEKNQDANEEVFSRMSRFIEVKTFGGRMVGNAAGTVAQPRKIHLSSRQKLMAAEERRLLCRDTRTRGNQAVCT